MKTIIIAALAVAVAATAPVAATAQTTPPAASLTLANVGFLGSECVRYDDKADDYIVSNLGDGGDANDGFLSRVSPDGKVTQLKWIEGGRNGVTLVQPLGLFIKGALIYVADQRAVHKFDRATGAPRGTIAVPDAARLNDLTVADDGTIYVTDSGSDDVPGALYRIGSDGKVTAFAARDDALERVNGIALMADGTIVHGGRGVNLVFRDASGKILRERSLPTGRIDGIVPTADGALLVASQDGHNVYRVPASGKIETVAADIPIPAAIGWDSRRNRLLVPQIRAATLSFYELKR
jgi:sugar lactone lactonase YvrE